MEASKEKPSEPMSKQRKILLMIGALLLLATAFSPAGVAFYLAIINVFFLWMLFAFPLVRALTHESEGFHTVLFGLIGVMLSGAAAVLLVGVSCAYPASRFDLH